MNTKPWTDDDKADHARFLEEEHQLDRERRETRDRPLIGMNCLRWKAPPIAKNHGWSNFMYAGRVVDIIDGFVMVKTFRYWQQYGYRNVYGHQLVSLADFAANWTLPDPGTLALLRVRFARAHYADLEAEMEAEANAAYAPGLNEDEASPYPELIDDTIPVFEYVGPAKKAA